MLFDQTPDFSSVCMLSHTTSIVASEVTDKGLISKINKELKQLSIKKKKKRKKETTQLKKIGGYTLSP